MIYLLRAFHFWWIVREVLVDRKGEMEAASFIHALVWLDGQCEIENVVRVWEVGLHGASER